MPVPFWVNPTKSQFNPRPRGNQDQSEIESEAARNRRGKMEPPDRFRDAVFRKNDFTVLVRF